MPQRQRAPRKVSVGHGRVLGRVLGMSGTPPSAPWGRQGHGRTSRPLPAAHHIPCHELFPLLRVPSPPHVLEAPSRTASPTFPEGNGNWRGQGGGSACPPRRCSQTCRESCFSTQNSSSVPSCPECLQGACSVMLCAGGSGAPRLVLCPASTLLPCRGPVKQTCLSRAALSCQNELPAGNSAPCLGLRDPTLIPCPARAAVLGESPKRAINNPASDTQRQHQLQNGLAAPTGVPGALLHCPAQLPGAAHAGHAAAPRGQPPQRSPCPRHLGFCNRGIGI